MDDWKPELDGSVDLKALPLSPEEGFVLSRLDGATALERLPALTGLPLARVEELMARLVSLGAVRAPRTADVPLIELEETEVDTVSAEALSRSARTPVPLDNPEHSETGPEKDEDEDEPTQATHRALFESELHALPVEVRVARAHGAVEPELSAFCFDPLPAVIKAVFENPRSSLAQARLVARHHRNPVGLEALAARAAFTLDAGVRRWLLRNPQLPAALCRRLFGHQRLLGQYKLVQDRDVPEQTRRTLRELLRTHFTRAPAEERVELILATDGRALVGLVGVALDGKSISLLCGRTYASTLMLQNFARWTATPPALLAHLLRQEGVRRQPALRQMLMRHPNAPKGSAGC